MTLIDKNWGHISRSLGLANSRNGQNRATIENRISQALQSLTEDQHARDARQRLVAAITDVVGKNWENDIADCIRDVHVCKICKVCVTMLSMYRYTIYSWVGLCL